MSRDAMTNRCIRRYYGHGMHLLNFPGAGECRGRRITLSAESAISATVHVVLTNVVLAGK
jgi:hypothetical protein